MNKENFQIKRIRRKGKVREIVIYRSDMIRAKHTNIKNFLEENLVFSKFTKAYTKNSSIYNNAKAHMYNDVFIKIDIEKFFNNIDHKILLNTLYKQLNIDKDNKEIGKLEVANLINLCSIYKKGLPLGLVTSPILSNIYLKEFDNILYGKLKKMHLKNIIFTRYADDITISFKNTESPNKEYIDELYRCIINLVGKLLKKYKLKINHQKVKLINLDTSNHVRITGVNIIKINGNYRKLSVGRNKIRDLYFDAIELVGKNKSELSNKDYYKIRQIKGMESFILSIEKKGYEFALSQGMRNIIKEFGYNSLSELISKLPNSP
ncbi:reverse transcriptase domain-containing protein [Lederbergia citrisecunda]|uniref:reverse transcriptase domain-containing protein n=1 Tax=Lederbergia citrisecunda TaxID=2833583 RepID=UPI003D2774F1